MTKAEDIIKIALAEVGYLEKSSVAYKADPKVLYDKTKGAGSDNYTKYGKEMHDIYPSVMDFPAPWCDCFCDWCFYKAFGISTAKSLLAGDFNDYTVASAQMYKNKGAYYKSNPKPGDQIFFNNGTKICHTGLVEKVDSNYVYTIEGNTNPGNTVVANGGGVAQKKYPLNYAKIDGYGRPKYDCAVAGLKNGWYTESKKKYYYRDGSKIKGEWLKDNGYWYYLSASTGEMLTGWRKIYDKNHKLRDCYFDEYGRMWHEASDHGGYLEVWCDK